eukprot:scaffold279539_cov19-Tisochrysis_lutea.AAC.1
MHSLSNIVGLCEPPILPSAAVYIAEVPKVGLLKYLYTQTSLSLVPPSRRCVVSKASSAQHAWLPWEIMQQVQGAALLPVIQPGSMLQLWQQC